MFNCNLSPYSILNHSRVLQRLFVKHVLKCATKNYHYLRCKTSLLEIKHDTRIIIRSNIHFNKIRTKEMKDKNKTVVLYSIATVVFVLGMSYAAVPLYRIYCQSTGKGGRPFMDKAAEKIQKMKKNKDRIITVAFNADTTSMTSWDFKPTQSEIKVSPGETALAFFTAKNPLDVPINGVSTYSVVPYEAGLYLNKIQCFCFEEQRLNPKEEVDLPVFFYIDPEYAEDPRLEDVDLITLSYTFFQAKEGMKFSFLINPKEATALKSKQN